MSVEMLLLLALAGAAALSTLGVLLSRDNFYSAVFMSLTLVLVATIYAFFSLLPVFVLIVFVFVGAIGIVTVALAATYRTTAAPEFQFSLLWAVPVVATAAILGYSIYSYATAVPAVTAVSIHSIPFSVENFVTSEYTLLFLFLTSLVVLLLLSVLNIYKEEG
ncbi:hypothetical protein B6V00_00410 [ANME-1 cluster archaeon ex4572_4]|nr:MAG: hypothetical protein B6V00_00410 [ANME-1 cluster archaeon ex4572_4]